jgi:UDP-perosamine 4-acetyltransferase
MTRVVGIGAGGHAKVVVDILRRMGDYEIHGFVDPNAGADVAHFGVPLLGDDSALPQLIANGVRHVFIGVGGATNPRRRQALFERASQDGATFVNAIHPHAVIDGSATFGAGLTIMAGAIVNAGARLGDNVIVNTGAIVEHDCELSDHVHIATGARLAGGVKVGAAAHVGIGASVIQGIIIGEGALVGAGAVVVRDVPPRTVVVGVPARALRSTT